MSCGTLLSGETLWCEKQEHIHTHPNTSSTNIITTRASCATDFLVVATHLFCPQRFCSDLAAIFGPMTATPKSMGDGRQRQTSAGPVVLHSSSLVGPNVRRKTCLLGSLDAAAGLGRRPPLPPTSPSSFPNRWPGPEAGEINNDYQISPTQPMPIRVKAVPLAVDSTPDRTCTHAHFSL